MSATPHQYLIRSLRRVVGPGGAGGPGNDELLDRYVRQGDRAAFEVLVWRHAALIFSVCLRVLGQTADAEDAFQATVLVFLRKAHTVGPRANLASWLYRVAYRLALRERRTRSRRERRERLVGRASVEPRPRPDPEVGSVLAEELAALPEKYRAPLLLYHYEGLTRREAARVLGCPPGTVASRIGRGQERLRGRLSRRGVVMPAAALGAMLARELSAAVPPTDLVFAAVRMKAPVAGAAAWSAAGASPAAVGLARGLVGHAWWTIALVLTLAATGLIGSGVGAFCVAKDQLETLGNADRLQTTNAVADPSPNAPPAFEGEPNLDPDENSPPRITAYFERAQESKLTVSFRHRGAVLSSVTLPVAEGASITRNDKPLRLTDLKPGWLLRVMLSADESKVIAIRVRDPELPALRGTLKSLDRDRRITVTIRTGGVDQDRTLALARTVDVEINNRPAAAANLTPGMPVSLKLTPDGAAVIEIAASKTAR